MRKLCVFVLVAAVGWAQPVLVQMGPKSLVLNFPKLGLAGMGRPSFARRDSGARNPPKTRLRGPRRPK